jgi:hypothetical protein
LVGEEGFFGVTQAANRIADFVIHGAGDNTKLLEAGLKGIQQGLAEAEKLWGGELPSIAYETTDKALEKVQKVLDNLA